MVPPPSETTSKKLRWRTKLLAVRGMLKKPKASSFRRKKKEEKESYTGHDENDSGSLKKEKGSLRAKPLPEPGNDVESNGGSLAKNTSKRWFRSKKFNKKNEKSDASDDDNANGRSVSFQDTEPPNHDDDGDNDNDNNESSGQTGLLRKNSSCISLESIEETSTFNRQHRGSISLPTDSTGKILRSQDSLDMSELQDEKRSSRHLRPTISLKTDKSGRIINSLDSLELSENALVQQKASSNHSRTSVKRASFNSFQSMYQNLHEDELSELQNLVSSQRLKDWVKQFRRSDPRYQILNFFNDVAQEGANSVECKAFRPEMISPILRAFYKASVFTVWRPTSFDAIRKMMLGEAVGKSLDIKGKSAKKGKLSGFVPFLQIHEESHKKTIRTLPRDGSIRVFFSSEAGRDKAAEKCQGYLDKMVSTVNESKDIMANESEHDEDTLEEAMSNMLLDMDDHTIKFIDDYAPKIYGLEIADRLLWEAFVVPADISRPRGSDYETGRASEPNFQDMNFACLRKGPKDGGQKAVILQYSDDDCMCPKNLLMAYEENGRVLPVVSDFDCFLIGSRGVKYTSPVPAEQMDVLKWSVSQTEAILDDPQSENWTSRWLERLKMEARKGFHPTIPELGFSDPKSYNIMKHAIERLSTSGAVRHGAESFNYYFPQDLDDEFLVISDNISGQSLPWKYVDVEGLQKILLEKVDEGYTFPLNPKWILCDDGWKKIYDRLMSSPKPNVTDSMKIWYPPEVREQIERIHDKHPNGFKRRIRRGRLFREQSRRGRLEDADAFDGTAAMDLAEQELKHYLTLQRAKRKLRIILIIRNMGRKQELESENKNKAITEVDNAEDGDCDQDKATSTNGGNEVIRDKAPVGENEDEICARKSDGEVVIEKKKCDEGDPM